MLKNYIWGYGEIGKHAGLKNQCRKASRFDSGYPYQTSQIKIDKNFREFFIQKRKLSKFCFFVNGLFLFLALLSQQTTLSLKVARLQQTTKLKIVDFFNLAPRKTKKIHVISLASSSANRKGYKSN